MQPAFRLSIKIIAIITLLLVTFSIGPGSLPHSVYAAPLVDSPLISVSGTCDASANASFIITNSGGDMPVAYTWEIFQESTLLNSGSFQLAAGDLSSKTNSGDYGNIRMDIKDDGGTVISSETTSCVPPTQTPVDLATNTPTETSTNTPTPTNTPTETPTNTPTDTPTGTPTYTPTNTPTYTPTGTPTYTPTITNTAIPTNTPVPTHTKTAKPHTSVKNPVTSYFRYIWSGLYTATHTPTSTSTATSTQTMTPTSAAEAAASTPAANIVITAQPENTPVAGSPSDGSTLLPWLGLGLILMGSFLSVIFFRLMQK